MTELFSAEHRIFFPYYIQYQSHPFILFFPNDPHVQRYHWSLGKIAKRMPREHEKCACLNLNDFHLSVFSEGVC